MRTSGPKRLDDAEIRTTRAGARRKVRGNDQDRAIRTTFCWKLAAVGVVGLAVRLTYLFTAAPNHLPFTDPLWYHLQANLIAEGRGFIDPLAFTFRGQVLASASHPPLFALVLAGSSVIGGTSLFAHQLVGSVVGVGGVLLTGMAGREVAGERVGLIAAGLTALYPRFWLNDVGVMSEGLFALTIALVVLTAYRLARRRGIADAALLGVAIGLASLTRAEALLLLPLLALPLAVRARPLTNGRRLVLLAVAGLATVLVLTPWTVRNLATFARPVVVSNGDGTLLGANCAPAYHGAGTGLWSIDCYGNATPGDESERAAEWRRQGVRYATDHLSEVPRVLLVRVARVWDLYAPLQNARLGTDDGRPEWTNRLGLAVYAALVPFACAGLVLLRRRNVLLLPLVIQPVLVTITAALIWGAIRFRAPAEVAMVILAAVALDRLGDRRTVWPRWGGRSKVAPG